MAIVGLVCALALFVVWNVVGVRLVLLARRTRGFPEFALGSGLLMVAGIGYPLSVVNGLLLDRVPEFVAIALAGIGEVFRAGGIAMIAVFTWRVFRRNALGASIAAGLGLALFGVGLATFLGQVEGIRAGWSATEIQLATSGFVSVILGIVAVVFGWAAIEALVYRRALQRRVALGLAEPDVAHRMLLWGVMGAVSACCAVFDIAMIAAGFAMTPDSILVVVTSLSALIDSVCLYLAFLAPQSYYDRIRSRAAGTA